MEWETKHIIIAIVALVLVIFLHVVKNGERRRYYDQITKKKND